MLDHANRLAFFTFFSGLVLGSSSTAFFFHAKQVELDRLLRQSCSSYCEDIASGALLDPEMDRLHGQIVDGLCACSLVHIDPTPWNQEDQDR